MSGSRCQQHLAVGDPPGLWRKAWVGLQARPKASTSVLGRWPRARDRCGSLLGLRQVPPQGRHYLSGSWPHPVGLRVESHTQGASPSGFQPWDPACETAQTGFLWNPPCMGGTSRPMSKVALPGSNPVLLQEAPGERWLHLRLFPGCGLRRPGLAVEGRQGVQEEQSLLLPSPPGRASPSQPRSPEPPAPV